MKFFVREPAPKRYEAPPQFRWASVRMDITVWLITGALGVIGLGVWNGGSKITDLGYSMVHMRNNDAKQDQVNIRQDNQIQKLELTLAKQQGYLERILDAVESNGRRMKP